MLFRSQYNSPRVMKEELGSDDRGSDETKAASSDCTTVKSGSTMNLFEMTKKLLNVRTRMNDRILLVDDEEFCLTGVKVILQCIGVDVESKVDMAMSGEEAL